MLDFKLHHQSGKARHGILTTAHSYIPTPVFMPVGTAATVKGLLPEDIAQTGAKIILANTYHLMLRPGSDIIAKMGGLQNFMQWQGSILTDSGGYQVMSLSALRDISEEGVAFKSHIDGTKHLLSPESSTQIQYDLNATITMCFDECTPYPATHSQAEESMLLSMRWAKRSRDAFIPRNGYGQFGIVQGGMYEDLRRESIARLTDMDFEGYAIGGLAVGEGQAQMLEVLDYSADGLPKHKPRYLMGVGKPLDIIYAVQKGIDMFDCVLPTRSGRNGQAFTKYGAVNLRNARHARDERPLSADCACRACRGFSRAYLHHLVKSGEMLAGILLSHHNIYFYQQMMKNIRNAIARDEYDAFCHDFAENYHLGDIDDIT